MATLSGFQPCQVLISLVLFLMLPEVTRASSYMRTQLSKELWPYIWMKCDLTCAYGYLTDVEGNYVCFCFDPCQNVRCFGKTTCVVDFPKNCRHDDHCRPRATCRDDLEQRPGSQQRLSTTQADEATTTSSEKSRPELCSLMVSEEAKKCRTLRTRWFFDVTTGTCKEFEGCRAKGGNNFKRKKSCERTCVLPEVSKPSRKSPNRRPSLETPGQEGSSVCTLPVVPVTTGCRKAQKRWYFDSKQGTCQRFRGCETPGNNFRRRKQCVNACLGRRNSTKDKDKAIFKRSRYQ